MKPLLLSLPLFSGAQALMSRQSEAAQKLTYSNSQKFLCTALSA